MNATEGLQPQPLQKQPQNDWKGQPQARCGNFRFVSLAIFRHGNAKQGWD